MSRKNIGIAAGLAVLVVVLAVVLLRGSSPAVAAEDFLELLGSGKSDAAYDACDLTLQTTMAKDVFQKAVKEAKFDQYRSVKWTKEDVAEEEADMTGTLTLKDGSTTPVELTLILTEGLWRVSDLHLSADTRSRMGFQPVAQEIPLLSAPEPADRNHLPSKAGLRYLSTETILQLDEAIKSQNFEHFFNNYISKEYRKQVNAEQLRALFFAFYENKIDLSEVKNFAPIFDNHPHIDENGYFVFQGRYPTYPPTSFDIVYVFEDDQWKVFHVSIIR